MGYSTTFNDLLSELQDYVEDTTEEYSAVQDEIVNRAEDRVRTDLNLEVFIDLVSFSIQMSVSEYTRPSGLMVEAIFHSDGTPMLRRSVDWCLMYGAVAAKPKYFAESDESRIYVAPVPDINYTTTAKVVAAPATLSAANQTNWITDNAADLLLLASVIESEAFLVAPERISEFKELYLQILTTRREELRAMARINPSTMPSVVMAAPAQTQG